MKTLNLLNQKLEYVKEKITKTEKYINKAKTKEQIENGYEDLKEYEIMENTIKWLIEEYEKIK